MTAAAFADTRPLERPHLRVTPGRTALVLLIIVIAVVAAFPLAWMILTSLKTPQETMQVPPVWLPATSRAAYSSLCAPSPSIVLARPRTNGPPSTREATTAMPERSSPAGV